MATDGPDSPLIRVVWGTGTGPTAVASYDAALADAGIHEYNLAHVSSIVPPGATVEAVGTGRDLGPVGGRLWVVEARTTTAGPGDAAAALGWATGADGGVFYEAGDAPNEASARERVAAGLDAARALRDRSLPDGAIRSATVAGATEGYATAVVLAIYGAAESMFPSG
jgi:arginine decarboxylase